ncbi:MAG: phosphomannomutase/phosphoglucomutase [Bdellovibrionales bacterium]|nr:phosphomannomutase/phosphoglucomutase [Bdellovibrionales bacterium]
MNPSIFREYDIRGLAGKDLTSDFARKLGQTYAEWAYQKTGKNKLLISIGQDCRLTSEEYANALISGLRESGVDILDLGVCPTPLTYFSVHHYHTDGAIMITGSHNPAEYNGFKIGLGKDTLHGDQIQELKRVMLRGLFNKRSEGSLRKVTIIPEYLSYVSNQIKPKRKLRVVLDAGNGTASNVAPELFTLMGAEVIPLYCTLDGRFPNHHPDPTVPANLGSLISAVREHKADFGVGYDGDSDRIGAVDENGKIIYGDELMVIFSREVLKTHPGATIISEVKSSQRLYQDIAKHGGKGIMWKTGHSLIKSKMKETKAALAGEMSGHIFFADRWFGFDDAIYSSARLYEIVAQNASLSSLLSDLKPAVNTPEIRIDCEEDKKFALIEEAAKLLMDSRATLTTIDGLRVDFEDHWGLIRASNTQPVIVMRFEAQSEEKLQEIRNKFEGALSAAAKKIGHGPFKYGH